MWAIVVHETKVVVEAMVMTIQERSVRKRACTSRKPARELMHVFALYMLICAQISTKFLLVVPYYFMCLREGVINITGGRGVPKSKILANRDVMRNFWSDTIYKLGP